MTGSAAAPSHTEPGAAVTDQGHTSGLDIGLVAGSIIYFKQAFLLQLSALNLALAKAYLASDGFLGIFQYNFLKSILYLVSFLTTTPSVLPIQSKILQNKF